MPEISVIVPVYKVEKYIHRCIDSILNQTFRDFELILVDDGSPDNCGAICDDYAAKDSRIRVIHQANGGVSKARNVGIDHAKGLYIVFVDSDDTIDPSYLDILYRHKEFDYVTAGFRMQGPDGTWTDYDFTEGSADHDTVTAYPSEYMGKYYFGAPWAKMFRKEIIDAHNIRFLLDIHNGEDTIFVFTYLKYVFAIKIIKQSGYNYFFYPGSLAHRRNADNFRWRICVEQRIMDFFEPCNETEEAWLDRRCFGVLMEQVRQHHSYLERDELYRLYRHEMFKRCVQIKRKNGSVMERIFIYTMDHECCEVYFGICRIERIFRRVKNKLRRILKIRG